MAEITFEEWKTKYGHSGRFAESIRSRPITDEDPRCVWTLCWAEGGYYLWNGFHYVNRQEYIVTKLPFEPGESIFVEVPDGEGW